MLLNCGVEEDSWESLGLQGDPTILKEISPEYSLEGMMLKLKLQYFGHLMWRIDSFDKTLTLGKNEGRRRRGKQRMRQLMASSTQWTWVWVNSGSWWWTGKSGMLQSIGLQRVGHDWATFTFNFLLERKDMTNLDSILKSRDITWPSKVHIVKAMVFSYSHVWMWELDNKNAWVTKYWCLQTVMLEKTLESPLDSKEIKPVNPKGNQPWMFIGCWSWISNTLMPWCEELTHLKRPWCWEGLKAGEEGDEKKMRWLDGITDSMEKWIWINFGSWWWTERPGLLQFMGSQSRTQLSRLNWTDIILLTMYVLLLLT